MTTATTTTSARAATRRSKTTGSCSRTRPGSLRWPLWLSGPRFVADFTLCKKCANRIIHKVESLVKFRQRAPDKCQLAACHWSPLLAPLASQLALRPATSIGQAHGGARTKPSGARIALTKRATGRQRPALRRPPRATLVAPLCAGIQPGPEGRPLVGRSVKLAAKVSLPKATVIAASALPDPAAAFTSTSAL